MVSEWYDSGGGGSIYLSSQTLKFLNFACINFHKW